MRAGNKLSTTMQSHTQYDRSFMMPHLVDLAIPERLTVSVGTVFCAVTTGKRQPWPIRPSAAAFSMDPPEEKKIITPHGVLDGSVFEA